MSQFSVCQCGIPTDSGRPTVCALHGAAGLAATVMQPTWTRMTVTSDPMTFIPTPCEGCGLAYLTVAANPHNPHNPAECAAYKRGYEAGKAAAARGDLP
jgi:hypothetical protein